MCAVLDDLVVDLYGTADELLGELVCLAVAPGSYWAATVSAAGCGSSVTACSGRCRITVHPDSRATKVAPKAPRSCAARRLGRDEFEARRSSTASRAREPLLGSLDGLQESLVAVGKC